MWKKVALGFGGLTVLAVAGVAVLGLPLKDIRPQSVGLEEDPKSEARGRQLLQAAAVAHGVPSLSQHNVWNLELSDNWLGIASMFSPWPGNPQRLEMTAQVHTFDSTVTFLDGPESGVTWGIEAGEGWVSQAGSKETSDDSNLLFMLPTTHYFVELPQRLTEAPIVRYAGTEVVGESSYEVVFATWQSLEANREFDQYKVYIHPDTHLVEKLHYTVREAGSFIEGVCHNSDFREIDGFQVPFTMTVTSGVHDDPAAFLHQFVIDSFRFVD